MLSYKIAEVSDSLDFKEIHFTFTFLTFIAYCQRQNC